MASRDPRDPRTKTAPVGQQLDQLAASFDVMIGTMAAQLGEVIKAQQEANAHLAVVARTVADRHVAGGGVGGVAAPAAVHAVSAAGPGQVAAMQAEAGRRSSAPYTAGINYAVSANGGSLVAQTRSGIRSGVAEWLTGRADHLSDQYAVHAGESLDPFTGAVMGPTSGYYTDEQGRYRDAGGRFASKADAVGVVMGGEERGSLGARLAQANVMSRMGQAWSENGNVGRAVMAGMPQGALKAAGVAGAVITAGKEGWEWVQGQYAANRRFQEVYGGSNMDQIGDRFDRFKNHWRGNFSLLGADNYDKLFDSGMNMGLRGGDRDRYISTGADIMGSGANAQQTTGIMNMSIEAGLGLGGLAEAIRDVNSAAREAGVNASRARDIFMKNYEASSDIMFGSQQSKAYATMVTTGQLAQARPFQEINLNGVASNVQVTALRASRLGMSMSELEVAQKESAAGTMMSVESTIRNALDALQPESGGIPFRQAVDEFKAMLRANGEIYDPSVHQTRLGEYVTGRGWPSYLLQRFLASYGQQVEPEKAAGYLANLYTDRSPGSMAARSEESSSRSFAMTSGGSHPTYLGGMEALSGAGGITDFRYDPKATRGLEEVRRAYAEQMGAGSPGTFKDSGVSRLPVIESLLDNASAYGIGTGTRVRVQTKGGARDMTLEEAIREGFYDQIQSGEAVFVSGVDAPYVGSSISEALQFSPTTSTSSSKHTTAGITPEETLERREKEAEKKAGEGGGGSTNVQIGLTPEAARLLTVLDAPYYSTTATSGSGS